MHTEGLPRLCSNARAITNWIRQGHKRLAKVVHGIPQAAPGCQGHGCQANRMHLLLFSHSPDGAPDEIILLQQRLATGAGESPTPEPCPMDWFLYTSLITWVELVSERAPSCPTSIRAAIKPSHCLNGMEAQEAKEQLYPVRNRSATKNYAG